MFYLIGVAHRVQTFVDGETLNEGQSELTRVIRACIEQFSPRVIAEEHSLEAVGNSHSIAQRLADEQGLEHRFCDPSKEARRAMGYKRRDELEIQLFTNSWEDLPPETISGRAGAIELLIYFPMRERYWLECLTDVFAENVVFVCGQAHIEGFSKLLESEKVNSIVVAEEIGMNDADRYTMRVVHEYLALHPDPTKDEPGVGTL